MIEELKELINKSNNIVVFTGAGVSTGSGIKDFRSKDGLSSEVDIPMEILLSNDYFYSNTEEFFKYYKKYFDITNIEPNIVHKYLKKLEDLGKLKAIVTQNIDGLHSKSGTSNVYEIHGTVYTNHCIKCNREYDYKYVFSSVGVPHCSCGGIVKPDVVLYGEALPEIEFNKSIKAIENADLFIVLGSSLVVYPAAGLINYYYGDKFVIINRDKTSYDRFAKIVINDDLVKVFKELDKGE